MSAGAEVILSDPMIMPFVFCCFSFSIYIGFQPLAPALSPPAVPDPCLQVLTDAMMAQLRPP